MVACLAYIPSDHYHCLARPCRACPELYFYLKMHSVGGIRPGVLACIALSAVLPWRLQIWSLLVTEWVIQKTVLPIGAPKQTGGRCSRHVSEKLERRKATAVMSNCSHLPSSAATQKPSCPSTGDTAQPRCSQWTYQLFNSMDKVGVNLARNLTGSVATCDTN